MKRWVIQGGCAVAAVYVGWSVAEEDLALPAFAAAVCGLWLGQRLLRLDLDALVAGVALAGYLIGNRGFAQLRAPYLPLFVGEMCLGLCLVVALWRVARTKIWPVRRDALNCAVLLWLGIGTARMIVDFRTYGLLAVRDYAMVYYALFFFLAQVWATDPRSTRWLTLCLDVGLALIAPAALAFIEWPALVSSAITVAGAPLIFIKTDVAGGMMAAGMLWFIHRYTIDRRWYWIAIAALNAVGLAQSNSRAAFVALGTGLLCFAWLRARRLFNVFGALVLLAAVLLAVDAVRRPTGQAGPLVRLAEFAVSIVDVEGSYSPVSADLGDKADNIRFRMVWWESIVRETLHQNPWFGLGFGRDIAEQFVRIYYPGGGDDFTARSPHNFVLTVFARLGFAGIAALVFLALTMWLDLLGAAGWKRDKLALPGRVVAWMILAMACFGVVLEGPMGAIPFWILLGLSRKPNPAPPTPLAPGADDREATPTTAKVSA